MSGEGDGHVAGTRAHVDDGEVTLPVDKCADGGQAGTGAARQAIETCELTQVDTQVVTVKLIGVEQLPALVPGRKRSCRESQSVANERHGHAENHAPPSEHVDGQTPRHGACLQANVLTAEQRSLSGVVGMQNVTRRFADLVAVDDVTLDVPQGTMLGLIGPSGSGKTTMVRMLTGTLDPTSGSISVLGQDPRRFTRQAREQIAYMPQLFSLYDDLSTDENVGFVAALYGIPWWSRGRMIRRALEVVDLWPARNRLARNLSGGMKRRLELACSLVHRPSVLFLDEPTAGIDPMLRQSIWDELRRIRSEGSTLLVTTQYVGEAEYCDRIALLAQGELLAYDKPEALRHDVFGGDLLRVETTEPIGPQALASVPGISNVRQIAVNRLQVTVADAGTATPPIVGVINKLGIGLVSIEKYQPNFDEVFTDLVERSRREPPTQEKA